MIECSVVMPCLNEADTIGTCVEKAIRTLREHRIEGEVIVADNGSTDGSQDIARKLGARIIDVPIMGYGSALRGGIGAALGHFVIMGDADDSYNFEEIPIFIDKLRAGFELVQGCRLPSGGGRILPGAMPFLHRWWGNPMFSMMARSWFNAPVHDVYCGLRGFTKDFYLRIDQRCTGMEFATEMIIKASLFNAKITEVAITLHPDGRKAHAPHLKTFRDGWRTLRFFLMYSPRWLFLIPGIFMIFVGFIGYALAIPRLQIGNITFEGHTLLYASLAILCGYQCLLFAIFTITFAVNERLRPSTKGFEIFYKMVNLEKGLFSGFLAVVTGTALLLMTVYNWRSGGYGHLDYGATLRTVVPGATLTAIGVQTIFSSFFVSILGMKRE